MILDFYNLTKNESSDQFPTSTKRKLFNDDKLSSIVDKGKKYNNSINLNGNTYTNYWQLIFFLSILGLSNDINDKISNNYSMMSAAGMYEIS